MKPLVQVGQAYMALSEGEEKLLAGLYEEAAASYKCAMIVSRTIPEDEAYDHQGFDALCHTGLSGALVELKQFQEALASADMALRYFNRRGELNQDEGKYWIAAVRNRAAALAGTGCTEESLHAYRMVSEMIAERKGEMADREDQLLMIAEHMSRLQALMPEKNPGRGYKAWWEFWS
jgi:tetratricopeptide (TPR) repeat protein